MTTQPERIPLDRILPNPYQPRAEFDPQALEELAESIRVQGLIQPVKIAPHTEKPGYWTIVDDGERRIRAMRDVLGWKEVEVGKHVILQEALPESLDRLARAVAANLLRQNLDPIEVARALQRLKEEQGLTDAEIAARVGKSRAWVTNKLRLLRLPPEIQDKVASGEVPERQARALVGYLSKRPDASTEELEQVLWHISISVGEPEEAVRRSLLYRGLRLVWDPETDPADDAQGGEEIRRGPCISCPHFLNGGDAWGPRCVGPQACFDVRYRVVMQRRLEEVSAETGVPVAGEHEQVHRPQVAWEKEALYRALRQGKLEHLRLVAAPPNHHPVPGAPDFEARGVLLATVDPKLFEEEVPAWKRRRGLSYEEERQVLDVFVPRMRRLLRKAARRLQKEASAYPLWVRDLMGQVSPVYWLGESFHKAQEEDPALRAVACLIASPVSSEGLHRPSAYWSRLWEEVHERLARYGWEDLMPDVPDWEEVAPKQAEKGEAVVS